MWALVSGISVTLTPGCPFDNMLKQGHFEPDSVYRRGFSVSIMSSAATIQRMTSQPGTLDTNVSSLRSPATRHDNPNRRITQPLSGAAMAVPKIRSVIVTGGASGLGKIMSGYFAARGDIVTIFDIDETSGLAVAAELEGSEAVRFRKCDISSWEEQKAAFKAVYEDIGHIDVVVANAGVSEGGRSWVVPPFPSAMERGASRGEPEEPRLKVLDINLNPLKFKKLNKILLLIFYFNF